MKPTRLYIKVHTKTGMKYFGKSIKKDITKYHGSGKYWKKHIEKHGKQHIQTLWISEWFYSENEITKFCQNFCKENDIVNSIEWANLKEENGFDGGKLPDYALQSISNKLKGRTKEQYQYLKVAAEKKSRTMRDPNGTYQKKSRHKIKKWLDSLTAEDRKKILGHAVSEEQKLKLSLDRKNKNKNNCERVRKMSETKKMQISQMSEQEKKEKLGRSKGMKWYHNDNLKMCKTILPEHVEIGWNLGRKKYEN